MTLLILTLSTGWAFAIGIGIALFIWSLISKNKELQKQRVNFLEKSIEIEKQFEIYKSENSSKFKEQALSYQKKEAELKVSYQTWAINEFEKFKNLETQKIQKEAENQALKAASVLLQKWKIENEAKIRQDAINRSYSVNLGKITEHLVPFHQSFLSQFNPKDARFIGSPIDLIVFDGYADKKDEIQVYLVEIKTGNSKLTEIQKKIKESVLNGNIRWAEINPANDTQTIILNNESKIDPLKQLQLNFNKEKEISELISTIEEKDGETKEELIDRLAKAIEGIDALIDDEGYTLKTAILKQLNDNQIKFKTEADKQIFINNITKAFD